LNGKAQPYGFLHYSGLEVSYGFYKTEHFREITLSNFRGIWRLLEITGKLFNIFSESIEDKNCFTEENICVIAEQ